MSGAARGGCRGCRRSRGPGTPWSSFSAQAFADSTQGVARRRIPSWGLVATADKAIPADLQRFEYERAGARKVVEVEGASHSVVASQPGAVTKLIIEAANATD